jgi:putative aldouronate transport system permease protein
MTASLNTISRTIIGIFAFLLVTGMFSYAITRRNLLFRRFYIGMGVVTMYFSGGLIPTYLVIRSLGLLNNYLVYILPNFFSMFYAVIMISYFKTIPSALEECARIDGANDFAIFLRIFVPTATPVMACVSLYVGVGHWNAWFDTMLYTNRRQLQTLSHLLVTLVNNQQYLESVRESRTNVSIMTAGATPMSVTMATMVLTSFPIIVLYPFLQKYFIKGVMIGSIKG